MKTILILLMLASNCSTLTIVNPDGSVTIKQICCDSSGNCVVVA